MRKDLLQNTEQGIAGHDLISRSLETGMAIVDDGRMGWGSIVSFLTNNDFHIIALRGAGSVNGMNKSEIDSAIEKTLVARIEELRKAGKKVAVMFDGDSDSLDKPDIGYVAGRLLDRYGNSVESTLFLTAQKKSWYYPEREGGNLGNAHHLGYATYVFEDGKYDGDHNSFTQDADLVEGYDYEQWYVGASGVIANDQLSDFNAKVPAGETRCATFVRVGNNPALQEEISGKEQAAKASGDQAKTTKFQAQMKQREQRYGAHWDNEGNLTVDQRQYPNLRFSFVAYIVSLLGINK